MTVVMVYVVEGIKEIRVVVWTGGHLHATPLTQHLCPVIGCGGTGCGCTGVAGKLAISPEEVGHSPTHIRGLDLNLQVGGAGLLQMA